MRPTSRTPALAAFARPGSYLERQVRRFTQLWEINKTREIPAVVEVGGRLADELPEPLPDTVVHGDFRLGNLMVERDGPTASRPCSTGRWARSATRAPTSATCSRRTPSRAARASPLGTSPVTALAGFPSKAELVERYVERSGRDVEPLAWFEALALWKAAVFCEAIYGRLHARRARRRGRARGAFETAVPLMAETAAGRLVA